MTYPDWFSHTAKPNFEKHLLPLAGKPWFRCLQIGAFTGDASVWLAQNILTGEESNLQDIDTWAGSNEEVHKQMNFADVYRVYKEKTAPYPKIISAIGYSAVYVQHLRTSFNFVYIDGDHTAAGVLIDAELSWQRLVVGGILAFDDYQWGLDLPVSQRPQLGIDLFLERHEGEYKLLEKDQQVWIKKI